MSGYGRIVKLLPRAKMWDTTYERNLTHTLRGFGESLDDSDSYFSSILLDLIPRHTRQLEAWERQWGLPSAGLTRDERVARLEAAWSTTGAQGPEYLQNALVTAGFDVQVHHGWQITSWGVPQYYDPRDYLLPSYDGWATDGHLLGALRFKTQQAGLIGAGEPYAQAGEPRAQAGYFDGFITSSVRVKYVGGEEKHPYYVYVGGDTVPDVVEIPLARRTEFETLIRKLFPSNTWIVLRVRYI